VTENKYFLPGNVMSEKSQVYSQVFGDQLGLTDINEVCDENSSKNKYRNACCWGCGIVSIHIQSTRK
jgi:hypothetical protein